jgi:hypothetical protein
MESLISAGPAFSLNQAWERSCKVAAIMLLFSSDDWLLPVSIFGSISLVAGSSSVASTCKVKFQLVNKATATDEAAVINAARITGCVLTNAFRASMIFS